MRWRRRRVVLERARTSQRAQQQNTRIWRGALDAAVAAIPARVAQPQRRSHNDRESALSAPVGRGARACTRTGRGRPAADAGQGGELGGGCSRAGARLWERAAKHPRLHPSRRGPALPVLPQCSDLSPLLVELPEATNMLSLIMGRWPGLPGGAMMRALAADLAARRRRRRQPPTLHVLLPCAAPPAAAPPRRFNQAWGCSRTACPPTAPSSCPATPPRKR